MFLKEIQYTEREVDLKFSSIYPVYLKLWSWATRNSNKLNDVFPHFKKWEGHEFKRIFKDSDIKEVFGSNVIEFVKYVYFYHTPPQFQLTKVKVKCKPITTQLYSIIINNYCFYFIQCSNTIILCNIQYNQQLKEYFYIQDFLDSYSTHYEDIKSNSSVQYTNNIWFANTNTPFMAYPDGIVDNTRDVNKSHNIPFYFDFKKSYFENYNYINSTNEWSQGFKSVISSNNNYFIWEFVEAIFFNEKIVIITGFRKS